MSPAAAFCASFAGFQGANKTSIMSSRGSGLHWGCRADAEMKRVRHGVNERLSVTNRTIAVSFIGNEWTCWLAERLKISTKL